MISTETFTLPPGPHFTRSPRGIYLTAIAMFKVSPNLSGRFSVPPSRNLRCPLSRGLEELCHPLSEGWRGIPISSRQVETTRGPASVGELAGLVLSCQQELHCGYKRQGHLSQFLMGPGRDISSLPTSSPFSENPAYPYSGAPLSCWPLREHACDFQTKTKQRVSLLQGGKL